MKKTVKVRELVLGDGNPKICVPIVAHTAAELDAALDAIDPELCDLVEFRADFYFEEDIPALKKIRERIGDKPVIYTIRTMEEGGEIEIAEDDDSRIEEPDNEGEKQDCSLAPLGLLVV